MTCAMPSDPHALARSLCSPTTRRSGRFLKAGVADLFWKLRVIRRLTRVRPPRHLLVVRRDGNTELHLRLTGSDLETIA
jgi:hypothetical protein